MRMLLTALLLIPSLCSASGLQFFGGSAIRHGKAPVVEVVVSQPTQLLSNAHFEEALTYVGHSYYQEDVEAKLSVAIRIVKDFGKPYLGVGIAYSEVDRYNGSQFNFSDVIGYHITKHIDIRYSHWSNAGLFSGNNTGRDMVLLSYTF